MKEGIFMLFQKKTPEEKMEKLVHKKDWSRLADYVYGDHDQKLELAQALATSDDNSSLDLLLRLADVAIAANEDDVMKAVCESLKKVGNDHVTADLQEILLKLPKEKEPLKQEISSTIQLLHKKL